jgi:Fe2+ or Zn2+ uptake regulation protein
LDAVLKEIAKKSAFKVENHVLEFFGTCSKCASP